ncbi:MAG TPA: SPFH domain-containing protein, partial [Phormidium sp.]
MESFFAVIIFLVLGGSAVSSTVKVINQGNEALVQSWGRYNGKKLEPGLNFVVPVVDRIVYKETIREKVLDIPPQQCITRDNVSITAD